MRRTLFALAALILATPAGAQVFTGTTTTSDPTFNRPLANGNAAPTGLSGVGTAVYYDRLGFTVTSSGSYTFLMQGLNPTNWDTYLGLYSNSFNATSPLTNALIYNDDNPTIGLSGFTYNLTTGTSYIAIMTGFGNTDMGSWSLTIAGPGTAVPVNAGAVPEPATWAMLMMGFGAVGATLRTRRRHVTFA